MLKELKNWKLLTDEEKKEVKKQIGYFSLGVGITVLAFVGGHKVYKGYIDKKYPTIKLIPISSKEDTKKFGLHAFRESKNGKTKDLFCCLTDIDGSIEEFEYFLSAAKAYKGSLDAEVFNDALETAVDTISKENKDA